ncbi:hypothetical protein TNIN_266351 [Trichonephila inaurata madagascariensis]|uniref:Uncharacterized protein n=1 Tax=Trichonephila inaurata madagascariensis TaxID=2747483 RepID=A0A8X6I626_9ARAC|nr:hypothetical protein TNIN_266351 [Trichonephila inaurata madagascariensis]
MVGGVRRLRCPCRHPSDVAHLMISLADRETKDNHYTVIVVARGRRNSAFYAEDICGSTFSNAASPRLAEPRIREIHLRVPCLNAGRESS